jgi:hypothetical protein
MKDNRDDSFSRHLRAVRHPSWADDPVYIVRLVGQVVRVNVETTVLAFRVIIATVKTRPGHRWTPPFRLAVLPWQR